jgi:UDP-glucose 4-epimerase
MVRSLKTAKVVVTGSRGYVGTATKELLEDSGYEVIEIDKKITEHSAKVLKSVAIFYYIIEKSFLTF